MPDSGTIELPPSHPLHLFTVDEAAELLRVNRATLNRWCAKEKVPFRNILGSGRKFTRADLERIIRDAYRGPR